MTYLLDTHTFVWAVADPVRLGQEGLARLSDPSSELFVSTATAWELATKVRLGRFDEAEPLVAQYGPLVQRLGASHIPISHAHALRSGSLVWAHRDPFDRMLAAQSMLEHHCLITRDQEFSALGGLETVW
ncbi:MAG: type II toxin-antitoxin system VapC family toxin [Acidimicrobiales bacterium]